MKIPDWIFKTAADTKEEPKVEEATFPEAEYKSLLSKYEKGDLKANEADAIEEIAYLVSIVAEAVSKLANPVKEAAGDAPKDPKEAPKEEVPPSSPAAKLPERKVIPGKPTEPTTTKWKEIRYNKKDGKWQSISSTRTVHNFNTEAEALDFAKKI